MLLMKKIMNFVLKTAIILGIIILPVDHWRYLGPQSLQISRGKRDSQHHLQQVNKTINTKILPKEIMHNFTDPCPAFNSMYACNDGTSSCELLRVNGIATWLHCQFECQKLEGCERFTFNQNVGACHLRTLDTHLTAWSGQSGTKWCF